MLRLPKQSPLLARFHDMKHIVLQRTNNHSSTIPSLLTVYHLGYARLQILSCYCRSKSSDLYAHSSFVESHDLHSLILHQSVSPSKIWDSMVTMTRQAFAFA